MVVHLPFPGETVQLRLQADEHTYTTLIKTMSYAGSVDEALQVHFLGRASLRPACPAWLLSAT